MLKVNGRFGGTYRPHLHGLRICRTKNNVKAGGKHCHLDEDMLLQNVGWLSADYTALYPEDILSKKRLFCPRSDGNLPSVRIPFRIQVQIHRIVSVKRPQRAYWKTFSDWHEINRATETLQSNYLFI
jgi:hypothetical protein